MRAIERRARERGQSRTQAAIGLLEEAVGLRRPQATYADLDALFGVWSQEEAEAFQQALMDQRRID